MTPEQKQKLLDQLIAEKNGCIKYDPMLQDLDNGRASTDVEVVVIHDRCRSQADQTHTIAIQRLKDELKGDPYKMGYAGKTTTAIQAMMMEPNPVYENVTTTVNADTDQIVVAIKKNPYVAETVTERRLVMVNPPRTVIWAGIPYCRNMPSIDNINEALA